MIHVFKAPDVGFKGDIFIFVKYHDVEHEMIILLFHLICFLH